MSFGDWLVSLSVLCFLPVKDLEKRKDPKPRVKVVDKGNGSKPFSPEGEILFD